MTKLALKALWLAVLGGAVSGPPALAEAAGAPGPEAAAGPGPGGPSAAAASAPAALATDEASAGGELPNAAADAGDLTAAPQVPRTVTFTFKGSLVSGGLRLTLGELAACAGDRVICAEAYGVELGAGPAPGRTLVLPADKLRALLASEWPDAEIRVDAPRAVRVTAPAADLAGEVLVGALRAALAERFAGDAAVFAVTVDKATVSAPLRLRPGAFRVEFPELTAEHARNPEWVRKNLSGFTRLAGLCIMDADGEADAAGAPPLPFVVALQLSLKEKLPVPARDLDKGAIIRAEDLQEGWASVSHAATHPIADPVLLVGRRLRRAAPAYQPVQAAQVEVPRIIVRGQVVRLVMHGAGLDVTGQVVALGNAGVGQALDVVYAATKKKLRVRALDAATVEYVY